MVVVGIVLTDEVPDIPALTLTGEGRVTLAGDHELVLTEVEDIEVGRETLRLTIGPGTVSELHAIGTETVAVGIEGEGTGRCVAVLVLHRQLCGPLEGEGHRLRKVGIGDAYVGIRCFPPRLTTDIPVVLTLIGLHVRVDGRRIEAGIEALLHAVLAVVGHPGLTVAGAAGEIGPVVTADEVGTEGVDVHPRRVTVDHALRRTDTEDDGIFALESNLQIHVVSRGMARAHTGMAPESIIATELIGEVDEIRVTGIILNGECRALLKVSRRQGAAAHGTVVGGTACYEEHHEGGEEGEYIMRNFHDESKFNHCWMFTSPGSACIHYPSV